MNTRAKEQYLATLFADGSKGGGRERLAKAGANYIRARLGIKGSPMDMALRRHLGIEERPISYGDILNKTIKEIRDEEDRRAFAALEDASKR